MKKLTMLGVLLLSVSITVFGVVVANHVDIAYVGDDGFKAAADNSMKTMISVGAGYFLESNAAYQQVLNRVEMAEINGFKFDELRLLLNKAISSLKKAKATYGEVKALAVQTPYNPYVIASLKDFKYRDFSDKNRMNPVIFNRLEKYLVKGNVTGIFGEISAKTAKMLGLLEKVRAGFEKDRFPGIQGLWKVNQLYVETLLFGQYAAMVFKSID